MYKSDAAGTKDSANTKDETDTSQKCKVQVKSIRHKMCKKYNRSSKVRNVKIDADAATNDATSCTRSNAEGGVPADRKDITKPRESSPEA